jgi:D-arabinose 1-dehydrogenase-like Zn-dependent alcohol dehydrogenase
VLAWAPLSAESVSLTVDDGELGSTMGSLAELKEAVAFAGQHKIRPIVHTVLRGLDSAEEGFQIMDKGLVRELL